MKEFIVPHHLIYYATIGCVRSRGGGAKSRGRGMRPRAIAPL